MVNVAIFSTVLLVSVVSSSSTASSSWSLLSTLPAARLGLRDLDLLFPLSTRSRLALLEVVLLPSWGSDPRLAPPPCLPLPLPSLPCLAFCWPGLAC